MSNTRIMAHVIDQTIQITNMPKLASGSVDVVQIYFNFCNLWDGYGKVAVFYKNEGEVYHIPVADGVATVPHEMLAEKGHFFFGVMGAGDNTRTTEVLRLNVEQGAITSATAETQEPPPDIYTQLLAAYGAAEHAIAVERSRINELVAMRGAGNATEYEISGDVSGTIAITGTSAYATLYTTSSVTIGPYETLSFDCIPPHLAPLGNAVLDVVGPPGIVSSLYIPSDSESGYARLTLYNSTAETIREYFSFDGVYALASLNISELSDLRVGTDGTIYPTAGAAVREQLQKSSLPYIIKMTIDENTGEKVVDGPLNWDEMLTAISGGRSVSLLENTLNPDNDGTAQIYQFAIVYQSENHAVFSSIYEGRAITFHVFKNGNITMEQTAITGLDDTLTMRGYAADAYIVGEKIGYIENALDNIIAIQQGLISGEVTPVSIAEGVSEQ